MTPIYIYALVDPTTLEPRYVGKSIRPQQRLRDHVNEPPSNCHRSHWIQSLKAQGLTPDIVILEKLTDDSYPWQKVEQETIAELRAVGWDLTNNTIGGDGVIGPPAEARERMAATWRGRKHRPETIEKLRRCRHGFRHTDETKARMRRAHAGRVITWGAEISEALCKFSPERETEVRCRLSSGERGIDLAREYGVHRTTISKIKKGTYRVAK